MFHLVWNLYRSRLFHSARNFDLASLVYPKFQLRPEVSRTPISFLFSVGRLLTSHCRKFFVFATLYFSCALWTWRWSLYLSQQNSSQYDRRIDQQCACKSWVPFQSLQRSLRSCPQVCRIGKKASLHLLLRCLGPCPPLILAIALCLGCILHELLLICCLRILAHFSSGLSALASDEFSHHTAILAAQLQCSYSGNFLR